jgi:hypothetical protein
LEYLWEMLPVAALVGLSVTALAARSVALLVWLMLEARRRAIRIPVVFAEGIVCTPQGTMR